MSTAVKPSVSVKRVTFSGGQTIILGSNDIVVLVGPNNCGKSKTIREIHDALPSHQKSDQLSDSNLVVKKIELSKTGTAVDLLQYLEAHGKRHSGDLVYGRTRLNEYSVKHFDLAFLGDTADVFRVMLDAQSRLAFANTVNGAGSIDNKTSPQHFLFDDEELMGHVSKLFQQAFAQELFFDYRATPQIPIHVGKTPKATKTHDRVSNQYVEKVRSFPRVDTQGDGMRSYAGILFQIVAFRRDLTFIDEPEAFLHPPQMRRLGRTLADESGGQLFIATHSTDILRGLLEAGGNRVRVIRLERVAAVNNAKELNPEQVRSLWSHPQIKYSTALDAIFHEQAIICEDDSDCRLYSAVAEHLEKLEPNIRWKDTHYVPTGGKAAIPRVLTALRSVGVPVKVIFDLDLLADETGLKTVYAAAGGSWDEIAKKWKSLDADVRKGVKAKDEPTIRQELVELLQNSTDGLPRSTIQDLLKQDKPWSMVKKHGKSAIPRGNATTNFEAVVESLQKLGIYVVEAGEVEAFCPDIGKHGPEYVMTLLEEKDLGSPPLAPLRNFVRTVLQS